MLSLQIASAPLEGEIERANAMGVNLDPQVKSRLLASMLAGRLVVVCGAGLSMAAPSSLPAAWRVAQDCFDNYQVNVDPDINPDLRHDLEALAQHFVDLGTLESVFIQALVPWGDFVRPPNAGHAAIADFLVTKAAAAALSANYDMLIEQCAVANGFDFQNALDGDEATLRSHTQAPLLKFHGCAGRDRPATVWAASQLDAPPISQRIALSKTWMAANLRQKDLLVVGFWSDWDYLNALLGTVLDGLAPTSVTLVDPSPIADLEAKAPALWTLAHGEGVTLTHVQESGADVLDELRRGFSVNYLRAMLAAGRNAFEQSSGVACDPAWLTVEAYDSETLYNLRRDAEGVPAGRPARRARPEICEVLGAFHLLLRSAGATPTPEGYEHAGRSVRVVNGAGAVLSQLRSRFSEAPSIAQADLVIAPGATNWAVPGNVVREGRPRDFMRPAPANNWYDLEGGRAELGL